MTHAVVNETINAPIDAVWANLGNFAGIEPGPGIDSVAYEGEGVGMVRHIGLPNGLVVERLEVHDQASHTFAYAIINDDCPLPFSDYSARVVMTDNGAGGTDIEWTGTFEPKGVDDDQAIKIATGIYTGAIARTRKNLSA